MNPIWRERIVAVLAIALGVWLAFDLADGALALPFAVGAVALGAIMLHVTGMTIDAIVLAALCLGYIVGNRGFAQLMPVPGLPLLPAEIGLAIAAACVGWRSARDKRLPWQPDALNYALLAWVIVGTARFAFDFPRFGFVALRDYATVYYVAFFFIAQQLGRDERTRRFLFRSLFVASAVLPFVFALTEFFPEFFLGTLTIRGVPLIYYKGDIAPAFLAVCGIVLFLCAPPGQRWWVRTLATLMLVRVFAGDNRASTLGILVGLAWMAFSRFRRFAWFQVGLATIALLALVTFANFFETPWAAQKVRSLAERAMSVVDLSGRFGYTTEESISKTDNNQFRWVWWRTVASESIEYNPALGLGFGYDLARGFLQEYNPEMGEDFTARSPHNILVTALGRMGLVGCAIWLWIVTSIIARTWQAVRDPRSAATQVALWAGLWPILITAHLGVVLEGPMGAVVFWSMLGLASAYRTATPESVPEETEARPAELAGEPVDVEPLIVRRTP